MYIYVVKEGDNVDSIAARTGAAVEKLIWENQLEYPYRLAVGQALFISGGQYGGAGGTPADKIPVGSIPVGNIPTGNVSAGNMSAGNTTLGNVPTEKPPLYVFGYAYPFINGQTLRDTLPHLTDLYVFSYGFTESGNLVPPATNDLWMLEEIVKSGAGPVLTLTPLGADGRFNNNLVTNLVHNPAVQQRLIWELGQTMQEGKFTGLDFDFEYVESRDRQAYGDFVRKVTGIMNQFGYEVTVAMAPKTSADQQGLLYEGIDYGLLGSAANRAFLMTYEWGYSQGPPMAVAPINMVRRVVDYGVREIPREKISLGIPNYGYDWPLPYERGVTRARTINNLEAIQLAIDFGVEIQFDQTAQSPYFRYWQYGVQHEVWFEDARSIKAKFDLIKEYGLAGAGYWQLMNYFRANWLMLEEMFEVERRKQR